MAKTTRWHSDQPRYVKMRNRVGTEYTHKITFQHGLTAISPA